MGAEILGKKIWKCACGCNAFYRDIINQVVSALGPGGKQIVVPVPIGQRFRCIQCDDILIMKDQEASPVIVDAGAAADPGVAGDGK